MYDGKLKFEVTKRCKISIADAIYAEIKDTGWKMKLYLDIDTGDVLYPISAENLLPGVKIDFANKEHVFCALTLSAPESKIDRVAECFNMAHDVIAAAREFIEEEQQRFKERNGKST